MITVAILIFLLIKRQDKVERYIYTICIWTLLCYVITQVLSLFGAITTRKLWACWGMCVLALLVLNVMKYKRDKCSGRISELRGFHMSRLQIIFGFFAVVMLFLAVRTVPYNYDSMTYHLPRVYHWVQNETVAHYATNIERQVSTSPLPEYIILNIYAMMNKCDWLVNLLQCCSYLTNGVLVFYIAKKINCSRKYCILASVLYYTSPIIFAEALTTQTDNFAALWALCFAYLLFDFLHIENKILWNRDSIFRVIMLSLCLALGYLAKSSICIGMALFAVWLLIIVIKRKDNIAVISKYLILSVCIMAIIVAPEMVRNIKTFEAISAPDVSARQIVGTLQPNYVFINFLKNFTFNMPTIWINGSSDIIFKAVTWFARIMNVDVDDARITDYPRFLVGPEGSIGHDTGSNPIFIWLFVACILLFLIKNRKQSWEDIGKQYYAVTSVGIFVFCIIIRWQPFLARFMISYMAVSIPALASQMEAFFQSKVKKNWGGGKQFVY